MGGRAEPPDACVTMEPSHEGSSQPGVPPYEFYLDKETVLNRLSVHFAIKAHGQDSFAGFMVQARDDTTGLPVGEFDVGCVDIKVMSCFGVFAVSYFLYYTKMGIVCRQYLNIGSFKLFLSQK